MFQKVSKKISQEMYSIFIFVFLADCSMYIVYLATVTDDSL